MRVSTTILINALLLSACSPAEPGGGDGFVVDEGKEDDFISLSAQEYVIEGRATVTVEPEYLEGDSAALDLRVRELVGYQQVAIAWFLTQYFIDKEEDDANADFGGYSAMARGNTYESLDIRDEGEGVYSFAVSQLIAGPRDLLQKLPTELNEEGVRELVLTIGTPSNHELARLETNHEWYRSSPWNHWNPDSVDESRKTDLTLTIRPEVESEDSWFDYPALFEDDLLTVDVHFGWDYHGAYHVKHARSLFNWLRRRGFEPPVDRFEDLDRTSGVFARTIKAGGRDVDVEIRIYYGHEDGQTDPDTESGGRALEDDMRRSLATRDVIIYSGHSGPFYGFALANWRTTSEGDFDDSEMSSAEMPRDRYQLVVAEGCDTYHIGEAFRHNPAKPDGRYIDIITTTAPSSASSPATVQDTISALVATDSKDRHDPQPILRLLRDLDGNSWGRHTMYGVHGIDDNPHIHPWANVDALCQSCRTAEDCGGPGNLCVEVEEGGGHRCVPRCTGDDGCPQGAVCRSIASSHRNVIYDSGCVPRRLSCD